MYQYFVYLFVYVIRPYIKVFALNEHLFRCHIIIFICIFCNVTCFINRYYKIGLTHFFDETKTCNAPWNHKMITPFWGITFILQMLIYLSHRFMTYGAFPYARDTLNCKYCSPETSFMNKICLFKIWNAKTCFKQHQCMWKFLVC